MSPTIAASFAIQVLEREVPDWAVNCGPNLLEGWGAPLLPMESTVIGNAMTELRIRRNLDSNLPAWAEPKILEAGLTTSGIQLHLTKKWCKGPPCTDSFGPFSLFN